MSDPDVTGAHWNFALDVYGAPNVADACLKLQDRHGVDVNVLLVALWAAGTRKVHIDAKRIAEMDRAVKGLREIAIQPVRQVRRWMKEAKELGPLREPALKEVQQAELALEQLEQALLADLVEGWRERGTLSAPAVRSTAGAVVSYYAAQNKTEGDLHRSHYEVERVARAAARQKT